MNTKKLTIKILLGIGLILLQLTPTMFITLNTTSQDQPKQSYTPPSINELYIDSDGPQGEFFVSVDQKCDLVVEAFDPDWDMEKMEIYLEIYTQENSTVDLIQTIWYPVNSETYKINLIPHLLKAKHDVGIKVEVTDLNLNKVERRIDFNLKNIFGTETFWDDKGRQITNCFTYDFDSFKDRNIQKFDVLDSQYIFDQDYKPKTDYEFNFTLVWDQKSNFSEKVFFGVRAGHFIQKENGDNQYFRIWDNMLPANHKSILAGENLRDEWSRKAGFYFTFVHTNDSDVVYPIILKTTYPAWYESEDPANKPLRLLKFNKENNTWAVLDQSLIVRKAEANTVELFINSSGLYAFGRYSWDYEKEIRDLEARESISGYPTIIFGIISLMGLAFIIIQQKRKIHEIEN